MIDQLDQTLKDILDDDRMLRELPEFKELKEAEINFDIPQEKYAPQQDTVNLYLYDIHENRELRDAVPIYKIVNGKYEKRNPPLRIDCSYMVTAWSAQNKDKALDNEHKILSQALMWLSQFPIIPEDYLPDTWKDKFSPAYQPFPVYLSVAQQDGVKQAGEFWAALGSPPRPYLNVVITITMDMYKQVPEPVPVVITKITGYAQLNESRPPEEDIQIGGRITNTSDPPIGIKNAVVTITDLNVVTSSDENGYYSFAHLTTGQFTFNVRVKNYQAKTVDMVIPADQGKNYDIQLSRQEK